MGEATWQSSHALRPMRAEFIAAASEPSRPDARDLNATSSATAKETEFTASPSWNEPTEARPSTFPRSFVENAWTSLGIMIVGSNRTLRAAKAMLLNGLSYLNDEITISDSEQGNEVITERVTNFLDVPWAIEKVSINRLFGLARN
jgi:hypothetical protein